ncbi:MAG: hypothetical protein M3Y07_06365 [Acidobacteriota bacterium]|nr:hypothetical protein [Acidobacteriota bacterium]
MKVIRSFFFISIVVDIAASVCFAQQSRLGQAPAVHVEASGDEPVNRANTTSSATPCWYDTSNRGVVANAYNSLSASGLDPDGADGEFQSAGRWNHFRRLPGRSPKRHQLGSGHGRGVPCITGLDPTESLGDQQAAFMMMTNAQLSHSPPNTWLNWTQAGADAAGKSNLCLGCVERPWLRPAIHGGRGQRQR